MTAGGAAIEFLKPYLRSRCHEVPMDHATAIQQAKVRAEAFSNLVNRRVDEGFSYQEAQRRTMKERHGDCSMSHIMAGPGGDGRADFFKLVMGHGVRFRYLMGHLPFGYCTLMQEYCHYMTVSESHGVMDGGMGIGGDCKCKCLQVLPVH